MKMEITELDSLKDVLLSGWHGVDKKGRPIWLERGGQMNFDRLFNLKSFDWLQRYLIFINEDKMKFKFPVCSLIAGTRI